MEENYGKLCPVPTEGVIAMRANAIVLAIWISIFSAAIAEATMLP